MNHISDRELRGILLGVENPLRYVGGEFGEKRKEREPLLTIGLCFPDLYEIGMSNLAIKILYNRLNEIEDVACERVFAPAPDFESALKGSGIPLYTLESGIPLAELDLLLFSVGYELCFTNIFTVLEMGRIAFHVEERKGKGPVVIAGGPAITNPAPYGRILDGVYIGEAETEFFDFIQRCVDIAGTVERENRRELIIDEMRKERSIWYRGKQERTKRNVWNGFSDSVPTDYFYPVATMPAVQNHGVAEIMRGCPNGCRFCHAGYFYRPFRERNPEIVISMVDELVRKGGYREITLASLSSGDYSAISALAEHITEEYSGEGISLSLPSLRVDGFTLPLLEKLSTVRKGSLTFAVETPDDFWQRCLNKEVTRDRVIEILRTAKQLGWRNAKFYFMQGLPLSIEETANETERIMEFLRVIQQRTGMNISVNIGTFVPKPHTPFQWSPMLDPEEAQKRIWQMRDNLPRQRFKVGYHHPFSSFLEGMISRGDERVGDIVERAYRKGARLDAWEDYLRIDIWKETIAETEWNVTEETLRERGKEEVLPWDNIDTGTKKGYFRREYEKGRAGETTSPCSEDCRHQCGSCDDDFGTVRKAGGTAPISDKEIKRRETKNEPGENDLANRILFSFVKSGKGKYIPHIALMTLMERALQRAGFRVKYSEGFNPKPKLEFASPLSVGIETREDIASIYLHDYRGEQDFITRMNAALPEESVHVTKAMPVSEEIKIKRSLMANYWGSLYRIREIPVPGSVSGFEGNKGLLSELLIRGEAGYISENTGEDGCIDFILKNTGRKESNLLSILKSVWGESYYLSVLTERIRTFAGKQEDDAGISFFEYYS